MTYVSNMRTDRLFQVLGFRQFMGGGMGFANRFGPSLAVRSAKLSSVFTGLIFKALCGWNPDNNFSAARIPIIAAHQPGGTSVQVMAHWSQAIRNGGFSKYDYGKKKNLEVYGEEVPPDYKLSELGDVNIAVFYGGADKLTCPCDVERLISELPNKPVNVHYEPEYAHLDFVWGLDANVKIYPTICELAKEHFEKAEAKLKPAVEPETSKKEKKAKGNKKEVAPISKDDHSSHIRDAQKEFRKRHDSSNKPASESSEDITENATEIRTLQRRLSGSTAFYRSLQEGVETLLEQRNHG